MDGQELSRTINVGFKNFYADSLMTYDVHESTTLCKVWLA